MEALHRIAIYNIALVDIISIYIIITISNLKMSKTQFTTTHDEILVEEVSKNRVLYEKHKDINFKDGIWNNIK
jgi:competence protein ComGC